jgi:mannose-1-phosphate guanylyltransferase/mannose-1-phosphate guanylyltransferase/mannose-6-phosphate isomerase
MLVCPSDHHIADAAAFADAARKAAALAQDGWLVSFGIEAKSPETGFGYLKQGEPIGEAGFRTAQFVEKPELVRAKAFLAEGGYTWNGGIFAFQAGDFLAELEAHRPAILSAVREAVRGGSEDGHRFYPQADAFGAVQSESVDYAVMENTARAAMVPVAMGWSDIGNWQALHAARQSDGDGNCVTGPAELVDCRNVLVDSDGPRVSVIGLEGVIVIVDGDEIMITSADGVQKVGKLGGAASQ